MNATATQEAQGEATARPAGRTNRGSLDSLTIRRRTTGESAAARAAMMRRLRIALPLAAVALIGAFIFNTRTTGGDDAFLNDFAELNATTGNLSSVKPQFSGVDNRGNPYEITADAANQKTDNRELVDLDRPRAVTAGGDAKSIVEANAGVFNTDEKKLLLKDGVTFEHAIGRDNYVIRSNTATVSIDDQTVISDAAVNGDGPGGAKLRADKMTANNRNGVVVFEGGVTMRLYPKTETGGAPAEESAAPLLKDGVQDD